MFHRNKNVLQKLHLVHRYCVCISKGYEQGYKWFCWATISSLGILNSLNTDVKGHYKDYMACSLCTVYYDVWIIMFCSSEGAIELHSPADFIVALFLSLFPFRPALVWLISQIAVYIKLRSAGTWATSFGQRPSFTNMIMNCLVM